MDLREVFGGNLRRLRHAKGMSQDELAYEAEISRSYLSQLEKSGFFASLKIIGRLAEALGVERQRYSDRRITASCDLKTTVAKLGVGVGP
jgi:transcriptional regulator with XRE-family HTH domain